jgi:hypothetical protein
VGRSNILGKYILCTVHSPIFSPSTINHNPYIYFSRDLRRIYDITISWYNCSQSLWRAATEDKRMVLVHTHGLFIT